MHSSAGERLAVPSTSETISIEIIPTRLKRQAVSSSGFNTPRTGAAVFQTNYIVRAANTSSVCGALIHFKYVEQDNYVFEIAPLNEDKLCENMSFDRNTFDEDGCCRIIDHGLVEAFVPPSGIVVLGTLLPMRSVSQDELLSGTSTPPIKYSVDSQLIKGYTLSAQISPSMAARRTPKKASQCRAGVNLPEEPVEPMPVYSLVEATPFVGKNDSASAHGACQPLADEVAHAETIDGPKTPVIVPPNEASFSAIQTKSV